jgi:hypothetical protein
MTKHYRALIGLGAAMAAALPATSALVGGTHAALGWRIVYRHVTPTSFSSYNAVAATDSSHAWAVGGTGVAGNGSPIAAHWHHSAWHVSAIPSRVVGSIQAVSADGARDAWAVTLANVLHWHNGKWTVAKTFSLKGGRCSKPPIWRRLEVPADIKLAKLHDVLQKAFGWADSHLHVFQTDSGSFGQPDADLGIRSDRNVKLEQVAAQGDKITYIYDFGDDWEHVIKVERALPGRRTSATRAAPAGGERRRPRTAAASGATKT